MATALITADPVLRWFNQVDISQVSSTGGKNVSLGEMNQALDLRGIRVPNGWAVASPAYSDFLEHNGPKNRIEQPLDGLDTYNVVNRCELDERSDESMNTITTSYGRER